jgi:hypothetical protein
LDAHESFDRPVDVDRASRLLSAKLEQVGDLVNYCSAGLITFRDEQDILSAINRGVATGLYIVQCSHEKSCFRAGAGGVNGDRSTIFNRLKQHGSKPPNRNDIDWTEYHRAWIPVWAVQIEGADRLTGRLCEALLIGELAARYRFIPAATGSGFYAPPDAADEVISFARSLEGRFVEIISQQRTGIPLRNWKKGSADTVPSGYIDQVRGDSRSAD